MNATISYQALLGQKYGHRALPFSVPAEDFEIMKQTLREHPSRITRDVDLLDVWYKCDTNSVPAKYVLIDPEYVPEQYRVGLHNSYDMKCNPNVSFVSKM